MAIQSRQDEIAQLQDLAFKADINKKGPGGIAVLTSAFSSKYKVVLLPESLTSEEKKCAIVLWMMCLSRTDSTQDSWTSLLLSLMIAVMPPSNNFLSDSMANFVSPGEKFLSQVSSLMDSLYLIRDKISEGVDIKVTHEGVVLWEEMSEELNASLSNQKTIFLEDNLPSFFPTADETPVGAKTASIGLWIINGIDEVVIHGVISLMIFLAGKNITEDNKTSIEQRRPAAIENKYGVKDNDLLTGKFKMSRSAHEHIHRAWTILNAFRGRMFESLATLGQGTNSMGMDVIWTTVKLMEYAGMQHTQLIMVLIHTYPWAVKVPALRSSAQAYLSSLREFVKLDPTIRPFYKLIHGDRAVLFPRRSMEPLIAVAVNVLTDDRKEIANFYTTSSGRAAVDAFKRYRETVQVDEEEGI